MVSKAKMLSAGKHIALLIAIIAGLSIVGYILLVGVYCLPVNIQQRHMSASGIYLDHEGVYTRSMKAPNSQQDNFTDALMLLTATNKNVESPWKEALKNARYGRPDEDPAQTFVEIYVNHSVDGLQAYNYSRYWHGYLIWLKPLLCLFDYPTIRSINMFVQSCLFVLIMLALSKKCPSMLLPTFLVWIFINPITTALSMQFHTTTGLMLCGLLFVLIFFERWKGSLFKWEVTFTVIGCLASYFDLLTFPLVTLGVPIVLWLFLNRNESLKENIKSIIAFSMAWVLGYGLFWAIKWLLGTVILKENVLSDAIRQVQLRSSSSHKGKALSWFRVMKRQLQASWQFTWSGVFVLMAAAAVIRVCKSRRLQLKQLAGFALVACFPPVWYLALRNHSGIHYWFTYRALAVSLYAGCGYIASLFDTRAQRCIPILTDKQ